MAQYLCWKGFISLRNDKVVVLKIEDGKDIRKSTFYKGLGGLNEGNTLEVGAFESEMRNLVDSEDFRSGRIFLPDKTKPSSSAVDKLQRPAFSETRESDSNH